MKTGFKNNLKLKPLVFALIIFLAVFGYLSYGIVNLPNKIYLTVGQNGNFDVSLPVSLSYEPETVAVMNSDDLSVMNSENVNTEETGITNLNLSFLGVNVKKIEVEVLPEIEVIPCGKTVGVEINTKGLMVLGLGTVVTKDGVIKPGDGLLEQGDVIISANDKELNSTDDIEAIIASSSGEIDLKIKRDKNILNVSVTPVLDNKGKNSIGLWLRDGTKGIGTITYYNPLTKSFGALGHGIMDVDTKKLISVKNGKLMDTEITNIRKGEKGNPGELVGQVKKGSTLGEVKLNTSLGLYGYLNGSGAITHSESLKIATQNEVHSGPAKILSNISGSEVKEYDIYIESVNHFSQDESKGMVIRITDKELLTKTNGIVQGMSGSPIIQDDKLIGAVTHVFVQNPAKGYGIFIENMIKQEKQL